MKTSKLLTAVLLAGLAAPAWAEGPNPAVDMSGHLRVSGDAARHRRHRLVSEDTFIRMSRQPGAIVLDARSSERYGELHVKGAVNLSFPDIAYESLRRLIPDRNTRILIYCNNNFLNEPNAFPSKALTASLNVHTINALYAYGYTNVFELGPLIDIRESKIKFEGAALPTS